MTQSRAVPTDSAKLFLSSDQVLRESLVARPVSESIKKYMNAPVKKKDPNLVYRLFDFLNHNEIQPCYYTLLLTDLLFQKNNKTVKDQKEDAELESIFSYLEKEIDECKSQISLNRYYVVLGLAHEYQLIHDANIKTAVFYYRAALKQNSAEAYNSLACLYLRGHGVPKDLVTVYTFFTKAAEQGCADALNNLATLQLKGIGVEKNLKYAITNFKSAAERGSAAALNNLGLLHENGTKQEVIYAIQCYQKAAIAGDIPALTNLGFAYQNGIGVEANISYAVKYIKAAAEFNDDVAIYNLGILFYTGVGVEKNYPEAAYCFRRAFQAKECESRRKSLQILLDATFVDPIVAVHYHVAMALNNKKLLQTLAESSIDEVADLWLTDTSPQSPQAIQDQAYRVMCEFLLRSDIRKMKQLFSKLYFHCGIHAIKNNKFERGKMLLEQCVPRFLSAEMNFEIVLHFYPRYEIQMSYPYLREAAQYHYADAVRLLRHIIHSRLMDELPWQHYSYVDIKPEPTFDKHALFVLRNLFFKRSEDILLSTKLKNIVSDYLDNDHCNFL